MPIYEYRCASCGHDLEALQKLSDAPLTVCPSCQKPELKKLLSAAGFQLKGSGWYATDFRNSGAKSAKKEKPATDEAKAGNGAAAAAGGGDTKTDAPKSDTKSADKPAATSESKTPAATSTTKSDT